MKITDLLLHLDSACGAATDKKAYLEAALAVELAFVFSIPTQPVESIVAHFEQMHGELAKRVIGEVNEMYPIATQVCYNLCVDFYKTRYVLVHEPRLLSSEDISRLMCRPSVDASILEKHREALGNQYFGTARATLRDFAGRYVTPVQIA
jgi:hypothetical protein